MYFLNGLLKFLNEDDNIYIIGNNVRWDTSTGDRRQIFRPPYKVGDIFAVAQSYKDVNRYYTEHLCGTKGRHWKENIHEVINTKGWSNKMFVKPEYMPHQIEITGEKAEYLQSITEYDAIGEGILFDKEIDSFYYLENGKQKGISNTPQESFSKLIDKLYGKGTWDRNPIVWAYEFKLIK